MQSPGVNSSSSNALAPNSVRNPEKSLDVTVRILREDVDYMATVVAQATATRTGQEVRSNIALGLSDTNRRLERENALKKATNK